MEFFRDSVERYEIFYVELLGKLEDSCDDGGGGSLMGYGDGLLLGEEGRRGIEIGEKLDRRSFQESFTGERMTGDVMPCSVSDRLR